MAKPPSTKLEKPIPAEFAPYFREHGWRRAETVFGVRATLRYWRALGGEAVFGARPRSRAANA